jgi:rubrerythrin
MQPNQKPINNLLKQTQMAINGEYSAIKCYEKLAKLAPTEEERNKILEIRNDEIRHFKQLVLLYTGLSGVDPKPKQTELCEGDYLRGLEAALKDEQHTVDFYLSVADGTINTAARELFTRAAKDEQQHAVWFLYYYMKNR